MLDYISVQWHVLLVEQSQEKISYSSNQAAFTPPLDYCTCILALGARLAFVFCISSPSEKQISVPHYNCQSKSASNARSWWVQLLADPRMSCDDEVTSIYGSVQLDSIVISHCSLSATRSKQRPPFLSNYPKSKAFSQRFDCSFSNRPK